MLKAIRREVRANADTTKAKVLQGFFKTGPGQYGEGDIFLGVVVPKLRAIAGKYEDLKLSDIKTLLRSPIHEERLLALLILVRKFEKGPDTEREKIYRLYLKNTKHINNWDLVDLSAGSIVGSFLSGRDKSVLYKLASSAELWERRIAIISTFHFIRKGSAEHTFGIAERLLCDREDLIHKAVGWMLREAGKRIGPAAEEEFLIKHHKNMPRTMLRYAIERFPEKKRRAYLEGRVSPYQKA